MASIRGNAMKQIIARLEREEHAAVLERISPETLAETRRATRVEWMPLELNEEIVRHITAVLGPEAGEDFFRRVYAEVLETPMFNALLRGIRALGARSPASFLKHAPRGYATNFRGVGHVTVGERTPNSIELAYHDLPTHLFDPELSWVRYAGASLLAAFDFSGVDGRHYFVERLPSAGSCKIRFEW